MGASGRLRDRLAAIAGAALIVAACSSSSPVETAGPGGSGAPSGTSAAGPSAPAGPTVPPGDPQSVANAATAEVDLLQAMRVELGVAKAVGGDGDATLASLAAREETFGKAFLVDAAKAGGLDLGATGEVRLAAFTGSSLHTWAGDSLAQGSNTISTTLALGTEFLSLADKGIEVPGYKKEETYKSTEGGITDTIKLSSELFLKAGNGMLTVDVNQTSSATLVKDGNTVGILNGDGKGHLDINGCPDPDGNIHGTIDVTISELWSSGGKTGTTDRKVTGTFTVSANDAAGLAGVSANMVMSGSGTDGAGGTWKADATAGYGTGVAPTVTSTGATQEQVNQTSGAAAIVLFILANAANKAAEYWQSGKCIELKANPESREVKAKEELHISVDAVSRQDGAQVKGPIAVQFSGKESLDPSSGTQPAPATYTFKAGEKDGDTGTLSLKQTSKRGIGLKTLSYKVGGGLTFAATGTVNYTGFTLKVTIPTTKLVASGDTYTASVPVTITGKFAQPGCTTKAVNISTTAAVTVRIDPSDPEKALVGVPPPGSLVSKTITTICFKYPATFPSGPAAMTWFGIFFTSSSIATVTIGTPTKLTASGAEGTVTIARATPS